MEIFILLNCTNRMKVTELVLAGKHSKSKFLSWEDRLRIAVDAALGKKANFRLCVLTVLLMYFP